jgi:hypothetical protein
VRTGPGYDAVFVGVDGYRDRIACGAGDDTVYHGRRVDPLDRFEGCETFTPSP